MMAIPDYQSLMLPVLQLAANGETRVPVAAAAIANQFRLSEEERDELLPSGRQRILHNRIHWAKFYLSKAGLIDVPARGRFKASEEGLNLLAKGLKRIDVELLKTIPQFSSYYSAYSKTVTATEAPLTEAAVTAVSTPEEQIDAAQGVLDAALRAELLQRIMENTPSSSV